MHNSGIAQLTQRSKPRYIAAKVQQNRSTPEVLEKATQDAIRQRALIVNKLSAAVVWPGCGHS
jgi:hypothetical protein